MSGRYIKVPWSILEEDWAQDPRQLGRWLRDTLEADIARRSKRRAYVPRDIWRGILDRFGGACAYCGVQGVPLQKDHRMPLALGGPDDPTNLVPACGPCNRRKFTSHPDTWPLR